jgi:serine/threonine protein kinase
MEEYTESLEGLLGRGRPTAQEVWGWAQDMARGLDVLHELGIIHTDLELRKVFVDTRRGGPCWGTSARRSSSRWRRAGGCSPPRRP